jgi:hypothetical protein
MSRLIKPLHVYDLALQITSSPTEHGCAATKSCFSSSSSKIEKCRESTAKMKIRANPIIVTLLLPPAYPFPDRARPPRARR